MKLKFIGDLSKNDVETLVAFGRDSKVLEFGMGGSTQIFAQTAKHVLSVETSKEWLEKTKNRIALLTTYGKNSIGSSSLVLWNNFLKYRDGLVPKTFDTVFVDLVDELRIKSANIGWKLLKNGGYLLFHDTRRPHDIQNVTKFINKHFREIGDVLINYNDSNITVIQKRSNKLDYIFWPATEGKRNWWKYGYDDKHIPKDFWLLDKYYEEVDV